MAERISIEDVRRIAKLARLHIANEEATTYQADLAAILGYMDRLGELDLSRMPASGCAVGPEEAPLREDQPAESLGTDRALGNAAASDGSHFTVPRVLGGDSSLA